MSTALLARSAARFCIRASHVCSRAVTVNRPASSFSGFFGCGLSASRTFALHSLTAVPCSLASRALTTAAAGPSATMAPAAEHALEKFREDYAPPPYVADTIHLNFILNEESTRVEARTAFAPNGLVARAAGHGASPDLFLDGRSDVKLLEVKVDGKLLGEEFYELTPASLTIKGSALPEHGTFSLEVVTEVKPHENTSLEGLYKSGGNFCTQCEAEGFRAITYFLDRPDIMAKYTTRIEADKSKYPVLLGNGNLAESGEIEGGRHFTVWEDPFRKPCYLFALVAGDLAVQEDSFTTMSGKEVALRIFVQPANLSKVDFAMQSLKRAMKWDEDAFGLEYDLDLFNIVAVDDFNMGAMENKSLNVFNSRLVLATPDTATDSDFGRIEGVVGHEYFHNWTGNRVTCRDWFQLTLKEGLTVYRDQEFSADMNSRPVKRIEDVATLRARQFTEDAGPMAHPVRPESYQKMDNFYTVTVYEKGAEVVRLYEQVLGKAGFRKGMDLYFSRHDGSGVTCDDFLAAMADANNENLASLGRWYSQAGTPELSVSTSYSPSDRTYTLRFKQRTPPTSGQPTKQPVLIPVRTSLLGPDGKEMTLRRIDVSGDLGTETVLRVEEAEQEFVFTDVDARPVPSLLRGFSAPVKMMIEGQTDEDLLFLLAHDTDSFNRWEAGQVLARKLLLALYEAAMDASKGKDVPERIAAAGGVSSSLVDAFRAVLNDDGIDGAVKSYAISLPSLSELVGAIPAADPVVLHRVRDHVIEALAQQLRPELEAAVKANDAPTGEAYSFDAASCARRELKNKALAYLAHLKDPQVTEQLLSRFRSATNMTDEMSALHALDMAGGAARKVAIEEFYTKWAKDPLVVLKWLTLQAASNLPGNVGEVRELVSHPAFNITNPNNCYSLFLAFARSPVNFHAPDGSGYEFLADSILKVDKINPIVSSRMVSAFSTWRNFDPARQALMKAQLQRVAAMKGLSDNAMEIASKSLKD